MTKVITKFELSDKQIEAHNCLIEDNHVSELVFGGGARGGKAQPLSSLVLTKKGFVEMGNLKIGDKVVTPFDGESKVIAIHPQGIQKIYEIEFIDGAKIRTTKDHLFECWPSKKGQRGRKVRTVEQMQKYKHGVMVPLADKIDFGKHCSLIDSYTLGAMLGDGGLTTSSMSFTTADKEIFNYLKLENNKPTLRKNYTYGIAAHTHNSKGYCTNQLADKFRKLGIMGKRCEHKFVPSEFKQGSLENRLGILQGLMDTDGTVDKRGHCSFTSKSEQLALDVQYLARSIGGKATLSKKTKFCWYKGEKKSDEYFEVYIRTRNNSDLFKLKRKKNRCVDFNGGRGEVGRKIKSIVLVGEEEAQCITIQDQRGLYISDDFVVTHNSFLGSFWVIMGCVTMPGSAWLIGREELKALKRTTLRTFFKVLGILGYKKDIHYRYNAQDMTLTFPNGSVVFFAELKRIPSDPEFDRLGSYDLTGAWIDECQEVCKEAKDTIQFRFTLLSGKGWVTSPKTLYTCNPAKTWIYSDFWKPIVKEKKHIDGRHFITSLYSDNPYIDHAKYKKNVLKTKNKIKIERLLKGNFEYDDDPTKIFEYDKILNLFTNKTNIEETTHHLNKYITCDVARTGDKIVIGVWYEWQLIKVFSYENQTLDKTRDQIMELEKRHQIPRSNVCPDADGMGIGLVDMLPGCLPFHNNGKVKQPYSADHDETTKLDYANLKTQCYFALAQFANEGKIGVDEIDVNDKEDLIEELDVVKQINVDSDKKTEIIKKEDVKDLLGRSPDFSDMMMMRMVFEVPLGDGDVEISTVGKGNTVAGDLMRQQF